MSVDARERRRRGRLWSGEQRCGRREHPEERRVAERLVRVEAVHRRGVERPEQHHRGRDVGRQQHRVGRHLEPRCAHVNTPRRWMPSGSPRARGIPLESMS